MLHLMAAPRTVADVLEADTGVKLLGLRVAFINQQADGRQPNGLGLVDGSIEKGRGNAASAVALGHCYAVDIQLAGLRLVVHAAEIAAELCLGSLDESTPKLVKLTSVLRHATAAYAAVGVNGDNRV